MPISFVGGLSDRNLARRVLDAFVLEAHQSSRVLTQAAACPATRTRARRSLLAPELSITVTAFSDLLGCENSVRGVCGHIVMRGARSVRIVRHSQTPLTTVRRLHGGIDSQQFIVAPASPGILSHLSENNAETVSSQSAIVVYHRAMLTLRSTFIDELSYLRMVLWSLTHSECCDTPT